MKIYISGSISGRPQSAAKLHFAFASEDIKKMGHEHVNPIEISPFDESKTWKDYMIDDIKQLLYCDAIYMLRGWEMSKGANIEYFIAKELGLKIMFE